MPAPDPTQAERARVAARIRVCRRCPRLVAWREDGDRGAPVPGFGDPAATVFLLGLATAAPGNPTGRPFTANRSADFLLAALHRAGLADRPFSEHAGDGLRLRGAWMASAVRCPPPGHRPLAAERDACLQHLRDEWHALPRLRAVVALGAFAWDAALRAADVRPRPRFTHGARVATPDGSVLLASYHPSPQNTNTNLLTAAMFDTVLGQACTAGRYATAATDEEWT